MDGTMIEYLYVRLTATFVLYFQQLLQANWIEYDNFRNKVIRIHFTASGHYSLFDMFKFQALPATLRLDNTMALIE